MAWAAPLELLGEELRQRVDEGCAIPRELRERIAALDPEADAWNLERIDPLYDELMALAEDEALAAREPNELAAIRALRPHGPRSLGWSPSESEAVDRFHGAWTGRAVGCALGKPVEGMGMSWQGGQFVGRSEIKRYLLARGDWPLADYFSGRDAGDGKKLWCPASQRERIAFMEPDDDIHYTLVGLGVLERYGPGFRWHDVADFWLDHLPINAICTAEAQAIENFQRRSHRRYGEKLAATPAFTRRHRNPYREWIGAQIRADGWAYVCAGEPELAAEFAYRDACWTHERNGIYGEMLFAAIEAAAFVESDPARLVEIGLAEIPADCRLARLVRSCLSWVSQYSEFETCVTRVEEECGAMSPVHTLNNALICVLSLFYGQMDATQAPAVAVMCGHDTDCNGATVGSIVGARLGRSAFDDKLAARLNDTVRPAMVGFERVTMSELARRTHEQWQRVIAYQKARRLDQGSYL
ncbi:MAG TPA: ADP-ribosylglycohydrolase family protein [Polyangiaceae bacterium]|nr:ADP-ribosylglycohydrolase family protein [Polyangiaceae bacterium]